jgi:hypothetical protein
VAVAMRSGCPARQPSPKKAWAARRAITASFPCAETTERFTCLSWRENTVSARLSLRKDRALLLVGHERSAAAAFGEERVRVACVLGGHTPLFVLGIGSTERFFGRYFSTFLPAIPWHGGRGSPTRGARANNRGRDVSHFLEAEKNGQGDAPPRLRGTTRIAPVSTARRLPTFFPQCTVLHSTPADDALPSSSLSRNSAAAAPPVVTARAATTGHERSTAMADHSALQCLHKALDEHNAQGWWQRTVRLVDEPRVQQVA